MTFERLFSPRSVAIVGASATETSISGQPLKFLRESKFEGQIFPVNPRYSELGGFPCFPDIASLPTVPDVVLVAVAAKAAPSVLDQCGKKGVPFAIVLSSGYAEVGDEGAAAQAELADISKKYGLSIIGPNCQGMMNISADIRLGFGAPFGIRYRKGDISLVSQSGAFGNAVLMMAEEGGLGFRNYLSTGNESCTTSLDVIDYLIDDDDTRLIAAYVEGFKDADRLIGIARRALSKDKPLLIWKVGNSEAGARAAASHTANLCGEPILYKSAFRQSGVVEVRDIDDLVDCAHALLSGARPAGSNLGIVTLSGGAGIAMADRAEELGLRLPPLHEQTARSLRPILPQFATVQNPLDLTAGLGSDPAIFGEVLRHVVSDSGIDVVAIAMAAMSGGIAQQFAAQIAAVRRENHKPIFVTWNAREQDAAEAYEILKANNIPRFRTPARCARGITASADFAAAVQDLGVTRPLQLSEKPTAAVRAMFERACETMTEYKSKRLLACYGIPITREILAHTPKEAAAAVSQIGGPVVLKVQSVEIPHKSEAGGVRIGIVGASDVEAAFIEIEAQSRESMPSAQIDGILVQEMITDAIEVIVGIDNTTQFGPVVMFGLGGIFTEVFRDVVFRVAPITQVEAQRMIRETRAFEILNGARGRPKADIDALAATVVKLSTIAVELKSNVAELDINPLFVRPIGLGVIVGDALVRTIPKAGRKHKKSRESDVV